MAKASETAKVTGTTTRRETIRDPQQAAIDDAVAELNGRPDVPGIPKPDPIQAKMDAAVAAHNAAVAKAQGGG